MTESVNPSEISLLRLIYSYGLSVLNQICSLQRNARICASQTNTRFSGEVQASSSVVHTQYKWHCTILNHHFSIPVYADFGKKKYVFKANEVA